MPDDRRVALHDAAAALEEGMVVALGGGQGAGSPVAFAAELVRRRLRLRLAGPTDGVAARLLLAEGLVIDRAEDLLPLQAAALGLRSVRTLDGREVGALVPDLAVLHAHAGDAEGRVLRRGARVAEDRSDRVLARAALSVLATVEQVVTPRTLAGFDAELILRPQDGARIVELPFGAWPDACRGRYDGEPAGAEDPGRWCRAAGRAESHPALLAALGAAVLFGPGCRRSF